MDSRPDHFFKCLHFCLSLKHKISKNWRPIFCFMFKIDFTRCVRLVNHSGLELWAAKINRSMAQIFCIALGSKWAINQNFWARAFFSRDRLKFISLIPSLKGDGWKRSLEGYPGCFFIFSLKTCHFRTVSYFLAFGRPEIGLLTKFQ